MYFLYKTFNFERHESHFYYIFNFLHTYPYLPGIAILKIIFLIITKIFTSKCKVVNKT